MIQNDSSVNKCDIKIYEVSGMKKLIPMFLLKLFFKPNKIFKQCHIQSIDFKHN